MQNRHDHPYEQVHESFHRARELHRQARRVRDERERIERRRQGLLVIAGRLGRELGRTVGAIVEKEAHAHDLRAIRLRQREIWLDERAREYFRRGLAAEQERHAKLLAMLELTGSPS